MYTDLKTITIPAPKFELYERVTLDWNEIKTTKIVARWYEYHKDQWWYKISDDDKFYCEGAFDRIIDEKSDR